MRVCEGGRLKVKRTRDVSGANFRLAERIADKKDCTWYGEAYCHGDEVIVSHVIFSSLMLLVLVFWLRQEPKKRESWISVCPSVYFMHSSFVEAFKQCN